MIYPRTIMAEESGYWHDESHSVGRRLEGDVRYVRCDIADEMLEALEMVKERGRLDPDDYRTVSAAIAKAKEGPLV